jgi:uncharacterized integral membrane protein
MSYSITWRRPIQISTVTTLRLLAPISREQHMRHAASITKLAWDNVVTSRKCRVTNGTTSLMLKLLQLVFSLRNGTVVQFNLIDALYLQYPVELVFIYGNALLISSVLKLESIVTNFWAAMTTTTSSTQAANISLHMPWTFATTAGSFLSMVTAD